MKVIILDEVIRFCHDHNFQSIGLDQLKDMAVQNTQKGQTIAYCAGYAKATQDAIEAWAAKRPEVNDDDDRGT